MSYRWWVWAGVAAALSLALAMNSTFDWVTPFGAPLSSNEDGTSLASQVPLLVVVSCSIAVVYGIFVRSAFDEPSRLPVTAFALGLLGVLVYPAYWLGLPTVFGVAALVTGVRGWQVVASRRWMSLLGITLGAAAIGLAVFEALEG